jgi:hypothetical protein
MQNFKAINNAAIKEIDQEISKLWELIKENEDFCFGYALTRYTTLIELRQSLTQLNERG